MREGAQEVGRAAVGLTYRAPTQEWSVQAEGIDLCLVPLVASGPALAGLEATLSANERAQTFGSRAWPNVCGIQARNRGVGGIHGFVARRDLCASAAP